MHGTYGDIARIGNICLAVYCRCRITENIFHFYIGIFGIASQVDNFGFVIIQFTQRKVLFRVTVGVRCGCDLGERLRLENLI